MKVGLFFGSFNPVHVGHMIIASHMAQYTDLDEIWMVVSPHNPLKEKKSLAHDNDRLHLVHLAIGDNLGIKASNIEFSLPRPSYTIDTLTYLKEKYPHKTFGLIMGSDNFSTIHKWKNYELLLSNYDIYVYNRPGYIHDGMPLGSRVHLINDVPLLHLSATFIRNAIKSGKSVQYLVPDAVFEYLSSSGLYS